MVKNTFLIGSVLTVLSLLCSCEKVEIPNTKEDVTPKLELTVHVTGFDISYSDIDTRGSAVSAQRISFVAINEDGGESVLTIEQDKDSTAHFGTFDCQLPAGSYALVAVVHNTDEAAIITNNQVSFVNDIVTDTFIAKTQITLTDDKPAVSVDMTATRVVALFRLTCNDVLPDSIKSFEVRLSRGGTELNIADKYSVLDKTHTIYNKVYPADWGKTGYSFDTFTFLPSSETIMDIEVSAITTDGEIYKTVSFKDLKLGINKKTDARGSFFIQTQAVGISVDDSWGATESIEF